MSKRKYLTTKGRIDLFLLRKGECSICQGKIVRQPWEVEHRIPIAMGGTNDFTNLDVVHEHCHKNKTRRDVRDIARAVRVQAFNVGAKRSRNPMPGSKRSKFKKHMDGRVTLR